MPDMHYSHAIIAHAIEYFEWITNERDDVKTRPLFDPWRAEWLSADAVDYRANASLQCFGHSVAKR